MSDQTNKTASQWTYYSRLPLLILSIGIGLLLNHQAAHAQFPGGGTHIFLSTDTAVCDPELGSVEVNIDAFGALGSALGSSNHHYNPFNDMPDQGMVRTIFEWKTFFSAKKPLLVLHLVAGSITEQWVVLIQLSV